MKDGTNATQRNAIQGTAVASTLRSEAPQQKPNGPNKETPAQPTTLDHPPHSGQDQQLHQQPPCPPLPESPHPTKNLCNENDIGDDNDKNDCESRQRQQKRTSMRLLKALGRIQTLETRLARCAVRRGDPEHLRSTTEAELQNLQQQILHNYGHHLCPPSVVLCLDSGAGVATAAAHWIESIYAALRQRWQPPTTADSEENHEDDDDARLQMRRHERTRTLLKSMTKGTQTRAMFDDPEALRGYTRQKFVARAKLVVESLGKVPMAARLACKESASSPGSFAIDATHDPTWFEVLQQKLLSIRTVCSIGCGPACEVVGLMAFLRTASWSLSDATPQQVPELARGAQPDAPVLERVILLDWAMEQWKPLILNDLCDLLVPQHVAQIVLDECDVSHPLSDPSHNCGAYAALLTTQADPGLGPTPSSLDLVVVSYLLTETRHRWHPLLDDVLPMTNMALFLDPTAWQLHMVCRRYNDWMEFQWLDSSLQHPLLQSLEGRVGPAVVLGVRRT